MRVMLDAGFPDTINTADPRAQACDILAFYLASPHAAHAWTRADLLRVLSELPNVTSVLPIYVYGPHEHDGRAAARNAKEQFRAFGGPHSGVSIALDVEQPDAAVFGGSSFREQWIDELTADAYAAVGYTSASAREHLAGMALWLAAWNNEPHQEPGAVATQFVSPASDHSITFDVSLVMDGLPLWNVRAPHEQPAPAPAPEKISPAKFDARPRLAAPFVALVPTHTDKGYWLIAADGGVFAYGDAKPIGTNLPDEQLAAAIVDAKRTANGDGLFLLGADGGVYALGAATFHGSPPQKFAPAPHTPPDPTR